MWSLVVVAVVQISSALAAVLVAFFLALLFLLPEVIQSRLVRAVQASSAATRLHRRPTEATRLHLASPQRAVVAVAVVAVRVASLAARVVAAAQVVLVARAALERQVRATLVVPVIPQHRSQAAAAAVATLRAARARAQLAAQAGLAARYRLLSGAARMRAAVVLVALHRAVLRGLV
ncbi:hypothetical protein H8A95_16065, partial [Bradyrhizobium sp. Pear76]